MSITIEWANSNKRRNSTKQFQPGTDSHITVTLKENTSVDHPTFIISAPWIGWNVCKWNDRYYFVDDIVSIGNGLWEVSCVMDVLATFKDDILASTQFVCYSSENSSIWLPDTRIPVTTNVMTSTSPLVGMDFLDLSDGCYVLSTIGKDSAMSFVTNVSGVRLIAKQLNDWKDNGILRINQGTDVGGYDFSSVEMALQSLMKASTQTGFIGNAYSNALNCIRGCHWTPFSQNTFSSGHAYQVYLGEFDTSFTMQEAEISTKSFTYSVDIPWRYNDWRRGTIEHAFIYLPFCGVIALSDDVKSSSSLSVRVGANVIDGSINYEVRDSSTGIVGTYGTKVSADYAIGINQAASLGNIVQTGFSGIEKTVAVGVGSSISPLSMGAAVAGTAIEGVKAVYDVANMEQTHTATCIGSFGASGVASNHVNKLYCFTKSNDTIVHPATMAATMGRPTMKPMSLANLTGFVQCANAHIECSGSAPEKDAIDTMLNTGIFIE